MQRSMVTLSALFVLMMAMTFGAAEKAEAARYNNPSWNGYALDWCKTFENGCGQPAADLYCQKKGSPRSSSYQIRPAVNTPTMTVGQNSICNPSSHRCDSFAFIDCQETTRTFMKPVYKGYRLDWCKNFENGCGQLAAQAYCQAAGYPQMVNFQKDGSLNVQTMTISGNAICNPQYHVCDGFNYIQCRK